LVLSGGIEGCAGTEVERAKGTNTSFDRSKIKKKGLGEKGVGIRC